MMMNIIEQTKVYIRENRMISEDDVVIAGVSGGADSVCLLFVLCELQRSMGFRVKVCHVNHGLRGEEADADERYVVELCRRMGVECRIFREDVELIARNRKQSQEEAGRAVRRAAFERMCREDGGTKIATAHHRDDNVETVLMNISRGTGIQGLCGIWPVRGKWIRPLLYLDRCQIEAFLTDQKLAWRTDLTNNEDSYTRNRIRHNIIPAMTEQINAGTVKHIDELSVQARELWEYLDQGSRQAMIRCTVRKENGGISIDGERLNKEPEAVRKQVIKRCIAAVRGKEKNIGAAHISEVLELLDRQAGRTVDLPGKVTAERVYSGIEIRRQEEPDEKTVEIRLNIPGVTFVPDKNMRITCRLLTGFDRKDAEDMPQKSYTKWIDYDIIKCNLSVRTRRSGDYLTVDEKGSRQKLKSYFINEKVPRRERERLVLIADGSEIVWIPGVRMSKRYQVGDNTETVLEIKITEDKKNVRDDQSTDSGRKSR
ncbi:MAG TPA: tRNA lysidine(34) synthetase TilS [Candidatus Mediterraneibacter surreyensis]|nr:tRNA lysidine(34) synthetase TilS [Candidatus Mediterraneibacter surreyensis]